MECLAPNCVRGPTRGGGLRPVGLGGLVLDPMGQLRLGHHQGARLVLNTAQEAAGGSLAVARVQKAGDAWATGPAQPCSAQSSERVLGVSDWGSAAGRGYSAETPLTCASLSLATPS